MNAKKKICFYTFLASIIKDERFQESVAVMLVAYYHGISDQVTPKITMDFLRKVHGEFNGNDDLVLMEELTEDCFRDLAAHMRNPEARSVFETWTKMSGTYEKEDLFVHTANVRHLTRDANGPTAVTLVVNSYKGLKDLLEHSRSGYGRPDFVEEVHSV
ncbi:MAG: hypothetical protein WC629_02550 [Candidatus Paceibacterota bacterium]|jgi:hypothetical protein